MVRIFAWGALIAIGFWCVLITAAGLALVAKHLGSSEFQQGFVFAVVWFSAVPTIHWLADKAIDE